MDSKLFLVTAQAGSGKTALLIDLAHNLDIPVAWYSLDHIDRDPHRFINHLIHAISHCFPRFGKQSLGSLSVQGGDLNLQSIAATMINEAYETIDEHFVIVLDDYHLVEDSAQIEVFLNQFILGMHENIHVVLSSRNLVTFPDITLWAARGQYHGLDFSELAFRPEEVQTLLNNTHQIHLPLETAQQLVTENEGWITGLLLSTKTDWQNLSKKELPPRKPGVDIYTYLAHQVLDQQTPEVRQFLLMTSLMEEFNADHCAAVLGDPPENYKWQDLINILEHKNLFLIPVGENGLWLRYHHLFRDFLQERLKEEHPEFIDHIYLKLAAEYSNKMDWEKAYPIYHRYGEFDQIAIFIEQATPHLWKAGRLPLLENWYKALPNQTLESWPILIAHKASIACARGNFQYGMDLYSQSEEILLKDNNETGLARMLAQRASWNHQEGNYKASLKDAENALKFSEYDGNLDRTRAEAYKAKGASLGRLGDLKTGIIFVEKALSMFETLGLNSDMAKCCIDLGMIYRANGEYNAALDTYQKGVSQFKEEGDISSYALQQNNIGVLYHFLGDHQKAISALEDSIQMAQQTGRPQLKALALISLGDIYIDLEAADTAGDAYLQSLDIFRKYPNRILEIYAKLGLVKAYRLKGKYTKGTVILNEVSKEIQPDSPAFEKSLLDLELGRMALDEEDIEKAIPYLEGAQRHFIDSGQKAESAQSLFLLANSRFLTGAEEKAMQNLKQAFKLADESGAFYTLIIPGRTGKPLLEKARNIPALSSDTNQLLINIAQFEEQLPDLRRSMRRQPSFIQFEPPKLIIHTFGRSQVFKDGQPIMDQEWRSRKNVRELFYLLLAHPEGQTKEKIGLAFWADASPAQLKVNFKNSIYRLRRSLGQNVVLYHDSFYIFNPEVDYQYDVEEFQRQLALAAQSNSAQDKVAAYKNAVEIYRGPYLEDIDLPWIEPIRENLRQAYIQATIDLSGVLLSLNKPEETLFFSWKLISEYPLLEEAYNLIMKAHAMLGNRNEINKTYHLIKAQLLEELNLHPSEKTIALYESLLK